jgi:hypothetical protein
MADPDRFDAQDRIDAAETYVVYDGPPYVNPLEGLFGPLRERCASLTVAELVELCRYWDWRGAHALSSLDRWWCSRFVTQGQRLLVAQGESRNGWRLPA